MTAEPAFYNALALQLGGDYLKLKKLRERHQSWQEAFMQLPGKKPDPQKAFKNLETHSITLVLAEDARFPARVRHIPFPPFGLYIKGGFIGDEPKLAMVGTRKATPAGLSIAKTFARELARAGLTIVSGLALGIDAASHEGALEARGNTLAVLARGLDKIYPGQNERLAKKILESGGSLISEYPIGTPAYPARFLERNRIVSGLALGVLLTEAPARSGTLATSRFAIEQNREVFVIPGPIASPNYVGSHLLIQSGAMLVTSAADILQALGLAPKTAKQKISAAAASGLDKNQTMILDMLAANAGPMHTDEIIAGSALAAEIVSEALALLTISNLIKESSGKYFI